MNDGGRKRERSERKQKQGGNICTGVKAELQSEEEEGGILLDVTRYLSGGQHCVFVQAEDSVSHDGLVGQEATAHHLQEEEEEEEKSRLESPLQTALICDNMVETIKH